MQGCLHATSGLNDKNARMQAGGRQGCSHGTSRSMRANASSARSASPSRSHAASSCTGAHTARLEPSVHVFGRRDFWIWG